ncbi:hypothetical protein [Corynebacterium efficiens YS-314]|uniref:Uncharacterized protein n=1 Tax=Corynebacterium efficiens (strain DSM 44549 / YS-314 / AJ 12310 / JCM 11189 / NBRC 100395) TaxID=196164 RepID=Q8FLP7_COREF|nr:hypothetical protein [Corynebacterium efficiens YS-314]
MTCTTPGTIPVGDVVHPVIPSGPACPTPSGNCLRESASHLACYLAWTGCCTPPVVIPASVSAETARIPEKEDEVFTWAYPFAIFACDVVLLTQRPQRRRGSRRFRAALDFIQRPQSMPTIGARLDAHLDALNGPARLQDSVVPQKTAMPTGMTVMSTMAMVNNVQIRRWGFLYMKLANAPPKNRKPTKTLAMVMIRTVSFTNFPLTLLDAPPAAFRPA